MLSIIQISGGKEGLNSEMLKKVRHQHFVISIPKMLNRYFLRCGAMAFIVFFLLSVAVFAETVLTEADCGKTVRLKPQEEAIVTLPSNPTTGYSWEMVEQGVDAAVVVVSKEFRVSAGASGRVGAGGMEHFRLHLKKAGRFTVTFVYRRSWEKEKEPERIFRITLEEQ
jgi:inhibitor of cysteine peptidase